MSLSPLLFDTYRRYKRDSKIFTQWLATTARHTETVDDLFATTTDDTTRQGGRNKDKEQNKEKRGQQQKSKEHIVPVRALVRLANAVATAQSTKVPAYILHILKNIIEARRACAAFYTSNAAKAQSSTQEHNEAHEHIIETLTEVLQLLSPHGERNSTKPEAEPRTDSRPSTNLYSLLEVEDCPESEDATSTTATGQSSSDVYAPELSAEETYLAIYCFMKDLTDIRIFVRRTWLEYKNRQTTLNTAATTANAALVIIKDLNEKFVVVFPQFQDYWTLMEFVCGSDLRSCPEVPESAGSFGGYIGEDIHLSFRTFFCLHVAFRLHDHYTKGKVMLYNKDNDKEKYLWKEEQMLFKIFSHLNVLGTACLGYFNKDKKVNPASQSGSCMSVKMAESQVLEAVKVMMVDRKFPIWAVFAIQSHVDTRRDLGTDVGRGFEDLQHGLEWIIGAWETILKNGAKDPKNPFYRRHHHAIRLRLHDFQKFYQTDLIQDIINTTWKDDPNKIRQYSYGASFLFKNDPLLCGLHLQLFLSEHHLVGMLLAGTTGPTRVAMHLSHAVSLFATKSPKNMWKDLEYIIKKHGDAHIFVDHRPNSFHDSLRHYFRSFGRTEAGRLVWADDKTKKKERQNMSKAEASWYGHRRLYPIARFAAALPREGWVSAKASLAAKSSMVMIETLVSRLNNTKDLSCPANPCNEKNNTKSKSMTPLQYLKVFKQALKEDDFALRFDLMSLNWRCTRLLRRIRQAVIHQFPDKLPDLLSNDPPVWEHVGVVALQAVAGPAPPPTPGDLEFFQGISTIMQDVILEEGSSEYRLAIDRLGIVSGCARPGIQEDFEDPWHLYLDPERQLVSSLSGMMES